MLWCDVHSRLDQVLKFKISISFNNFLCDSFNENLSCISCDFLGNSFSNHVIGFLNPTCAKVRFWVRIVLYPNPIPNLSFGWVKSVKT